MLRSKTEVAEKVVAVCLLTQFEIDRLGIGFDRLWPVDQTPCFGSLLAAIDKADQAVCRERNALASEMPDAPHLIVQKL